MVISSKPFPIEEQDTFKKIRQSGRDCQKERHRSSLFVPWSYF